MVSFDDMEAGFKDFVKAYTFPLKHNCANGTQRTPVKAQTDDRVTWLNIFLASYGGDYFSRDQVSGVATGVEDCLEVLVMIRRRLLPNMDDPSEHFTVRLTEISFTQWDKAEAYLARDGVAVPRGLESRPWNLPFKERHLARSNSRTCVDRRRLDSEVALILALLLEKIEKTGVRDSQGLIILEKFMPRSHSLVLCLSKRVTRHEHRNAPNI